MAIVHQWSAGSGGGGSEIFTLTEAELNVLVATSALTPFALYHVTDPLGNAANDLWVIAVAADTLSIDAEYLVSGVVTLVAYDPLAPSVTPYGAGSTPDLETVTGVGNTTTYGIVIENGAFVTFKDAATITATTSRMGYFIGLANFWNGISENIDCPWWNFLCTDEQIFIGSGTSFRFNVATTTIEADVPSWISNMNLCEGFSGLAGGMCNGIAFLFKPSDTTFSKFQQLQTQMLGKQPWGFFALINSKLDAKINNASSTEGSDIVVTIGTIENIKIFSWTDAKNTWNNLGLYNSQITNALTSFLWIIFGIAIWGLFFKQEKI